MPDYTIVAGPNGAGKSTYSGRLSEPGSLIFDADKINAIKEREYPDTPPESIQTMLTVEYWEMEEAAINDGINLTVESNLQNNFLIERAGHLKSKGFTTNLIFMLLPSIDESIERVNSRVGQKGHFVDFESIKYNFENSLEMLKNHHAKFDNVQVINSFFQGTKSKLQLLLTIHNNTISYISENTPFWAKPIIDELVQNLSIN
ncbi:MAG: zeta toxin family protein [Bacteroidota bacterium]